MNNNKKRYNIVFIGGYFKDIIIKKLTNKVKNDKNVAYYNIGNKNHKFHLWNARILRVPNKNIYGFATDNSVLIESPDYVFVQFDITSRESYTDVKDFYFPIFNTSPNIQVILLGDNCHQDAERAVQYEEAKQFAESQKYLKSCHYFEVSTKDNPSINGIGYLNDCFEFAALQILYNNGITSKYELMFYKSVKCMVIGSEIQFNKVMQVQNKSCRIRNTYVASKFNYNVFIFNIHDQSSFNYIKQYVMENELSGSKSILLGTSDNSKSESPSEIQVSIEEASKYAGESLKCKYFQELDLALNDIINDDLNNNNNNKNINYNHNYYSYYSLYSLVPSCTIN